MYLGANSLTVGSAGVLVSALAALSTTVSLTGELLLGTTADSSLRMSHILLSNSGLANVSTGQRSLVRSCAFALKLLA